MKLLAPTIAVALLAGCAPNPTVTGGPAVAQAGGRQCFSVDAVNSFNAVDRETVNIRVGVNDIYQMKLFAPCHDINWALTAGLRASGGGSFICDAMDVDIVAPSVSGPQVCRVTSLRKLSDVESAALPRRQQP